MRLERFARVGLVSYAKPGADPAAKLILRKKKKTVLQSKLRTAFAAVKSDKKNARGLGERGRSCFSRQRPLSRFRASYFRLACFIFATSLLSESPPAWHRVG